MHWGGNRVVATRPRAPAESQVSRWRTLGHFGRVLLAGFLLTPRAEAVPTGSDKALAEVLFREGRQLLQRGETDAACEKFAESHRLDEALGTLLNLAVCHESQGRFASAWAEFHQAAATARRR